MLRGAALRTAARALLAQDRAGLITDLDGTLSAIVPRPELATVKPRARRALRALVTRLTLVAVVSGRSATDARRLLGVPGLAYVGNHGLEASIGHRRWTHAGAARCRPLIAQALAAVEARVGAGDIRFESKGLTASIHYRGATDPLAARAAILTALAAVPEIAGLRVTEGRQVIELRPPVLVHKGTAALCLVQRFGLAAALFLGDDRTDLDAVRALKQAQAGGHIRTLTVAVASAESPPDLLEEADAVVEGVVAVEDLLDVLTAGPEAD